MADLIKCPSCGAPDQEAGKFCEQCGSKVIAATPDAVAMSAPNPTAIVATERLTDPLVDGPAPTPDVSAPTPDAAPDALSSAPAPDAAPTPDPAPTPDAAPTVISSPPATVDLTTATLRFIRLENGVLNREHSFEVPVGSQLLVGRTDPANGVFPEVDVTMWSARVATPEGSLYTIHRKQCYISRDDMGRVWIVDHSDYVGDTMVSLVGTSQFRPIPSLASERDSNSEGGISLEVGDRILMGQGEGMLIFILMQL